MTIALHTELHRAAFGYAKGLAEARDAAMKRGLKADEAEEVINNAVLAAHEIHKGSKPKVVPHTAGPFTVVSMFDLSVVAPMPSTKLKQLVATMAPAKTDDEQMANAKLFAGAPRVLAAAVKCLHWDDDHNDEVDHDAAFAELREAVAASQHTA